MLEYASTTVSTARRTLANSSPTSSSQLQNAAASTKEQRSRAKPNTGTRTKSTSENRVVQRKGSSYHRSDSRNASTSCFAGTAKTDWTCSHARASNGKVSERTREHKRSDTAHTHEPSTQCLHDSTRHAASGVRQWKSGHASRASTTIEHNR